MNKVMTVSELAKYLHVNPVWASRKAMAGELPAFKVGNRWRFLKGDIDLWIQGQRTQQAPFPKNLNSFLKKVAEKFQETLYSVILYGSYARGEQTNESDVDLLCIVKQKTDSVSDGMSDLAYQVMLEEGFEPLLSVLVMDDPYLQRLRQQQSPLIQEISREGKTLWKKNHSIGKDY